MNIRPPARAHPPDKTVIALLILAALGLLMIFFGTFTPKPQSKDDSVETYLDRTEKKLCETVARIKGAGTVTVFVTPSRAAQTIYAAKITDGGDNGITQPYPAIGGVLVVCSGGNDKAVAAEIRNAVGAALGLSQNKIYVTGGVG